MTASMILTFFGGVGLFLLGMRLMTDGLKVAAGDALRRILSHGTATTGRGILSGILITTIVQSSAAVTIASIGFVNAGLMTLFQSVGVIIGSNIGTTATSWLVALVGFKVNMQALAMPAIAVGMALRVTGGLARRGAFGEALTGFGIFFLGIDVLLKTFSGVDELFDLSALPERGVAGALLFVLVGIVLTVLMNSSSAALAVILTAAGTGLIPLAAAAAMVIGANIGTTSPALFSVIGATSNAKRAAMALTFFNVVTGIVAFLIMPALLFVGAGVARVIGLDPNAATVLAIFHTATKVTGMALVWPITPWLVGWLERLFVTADEDQGRPRFLDGNIADTPVLALEALDRELARIGEIARRAAQGAISAEASADEWLEKDSAAVDQLVLAVGDFTRRASRGGDMSEPISHAFAEGVRITQYYDDVMARAIEISRIHRTLDEIGDPELAGTLNGFRRGASVLIDAADAAPDGFRPQALRKTFGEFEEGYQEVKRHLLLAGTAGRIPVRQMVARLDELSGIRRIADQITKAALYTHRIHQILRGKDEAADAAEARGVEPLRETGTGGDR